MTDMDTVVTQVVTVRFKVQAPIRKLLRLRRRLHRFMRWNDLEWIETNWDPDQGEDR